MKIDFIISTLNGGGAERVLTILAKNFSSKSNFDITVITLNEGCIYDINESINFICLNKKTSKNLTIRAFLNLYDYYKTENNRPEIIISYITLTNLITIPIARLYRIPIIASEHNSYLRSMKNRNILTHFTRTIVYKWADLITVLTKFDLPYYKKFNVNVKVIPNPCSFKPNDKIINNRKNTILAIGDLDRYHHKGFDNLIRFIHPILNKHSSWQLKIIGGGNKGLNYLQSLVNKYGLENQIIFTGFRLDISKLMQESSIFILPSRFEGLPMVLLEAMSQGMACIAYDCKTGPSDIIDNYVNGILVKDQDESEMITNLEKLILNKELRSKFEKESIKSLDKFDIENISSEYMKIFNSLIKTNK